MTAENSQKLVCAPATLILLTRQERKNTNASGAKINSQIIGEL